jgi:Arc/MetJ-type ribon-helix-helix transcriptional regulator
MKGRGHTISQASAGGGQLAPGTRVMSVRLPEELAAEIEAIARVERVSVSEAIRAAAYRYIACRRADKDFQKQLRKRMEEDFAAIKRLSDGPSGHTRRTQAKSSLPEH